MGGVILLLHVCVITCLSQTCEGFDFSSANYASLQLPAAIVKQSLFSPLSDSDIKSLKLKVMKEVTKSFTDSCLEICKVTQGCVRVVHCLSVSSCQPGTFCVDRNVGTGTCYLMATEGTELESKTPCKISKSEFLENSAPDVIFTEESKEHEEVEVPVFTSSLPANHFKNVKLPGTQDLSEQQLPVGTGDSSEPQKAEGPVETKVPAACLTEPSYINQGTVRKQKSHKPGYPVVIEYECGRQGEWTYKYVTGTTEATCDEDGKWTLPALLCIPTNCYLNTVNMQVQTRAWYAGDVKTTKHGLECQHWTANTPHEHSIRHQSFTFYPGDASVAEVGNACRDFGSGEPWCYTMDTNTRWEFCSVQKCDGVMPCGLPPYLPGARPVRTETEGDFVNVIYTCQDQLTYHSGSSTASCDTKTGHWVRPDMFCYSTKFYYFDGEVIGKSIYMGNVTSTKNGKTCQRYDSQEPHKHNIVDEISDFPKEKSLDDIGNRCRDGDGWGAPWCYTTHPDTKWGYCDVPECKFN